jgi:hypothetical protein
MNDCAAARTDGDTAAANGGARLDEVGRCRCASVDGRRRHWSRKADPARD